MSFVGLINNPLVNIFEFGFLPAKNIPVVAAPPLIIPNKGVQGQTFNAIVTGSGFVIGTPSSSGTPLIDFQLPILESGSGPSFSTSFDLGPGITISSVVIANPAKATMVLTISPTAPLGFHDLTTTFQSSSTTSANAFVVLPPLFLFPTSGLDPNDMAILGVASTQILYWDYGNTQDFYVGVPAGQFGLTKSVLFAVSPLFANNWFGNQAPSVVYDPFSFNPSKPSNL